jgi:hypothetical protein
VWEVGEPIGENALRLAIASSARSRSSPGDTGLDGSCEERG